MKVEYKSMFLGVLTGIIGLRVSGKEAQDGLDITTHGERGYHL